MASARQNNGDKWEEGGTNWSQLVSNVTATKAADVGFRAGQK
jgi:hypothetical protein